MNRDDNVLLVPVVKGSVTCQIGRDLAANTKIVSLFQSTLKGCYPKLNLDSPYSDEKVEDLATDGSFGSRTEAAPRAVQEHIDTDADGIYGPNTRNRMRFRGAERPGCFAY